MPLAPVSLPTFAGGLNLQDQPSAANPSQAIDLLNVTFTERGAVKSRDGYAQLTTTAGTARYDSLAAYYTTSGTRQLVCGLGPKLQAVSNLGVSVATDTTVTASPHSFARFGGPTGEYLFAGNGTDQLRRWDGTSFTTPSWAGTAPTGRFLGATAWDNRLVNARHSGTTAGNNPSTVRFSAAGDLARRRCPPPVAHGAADLRRRVRARVDRTRQAQINQQGRRTPF